MVESESGIYVGGSMKSWDSCEPHVPGKKERVRHQVRLKSHNFTKHCMRSSRVIKKYLLFELQHNFNLQGIYQALAQPSSEAEHNTIMRRPFQTVFGTTCTLPQGEPLDILRWKNEFSFYVFIHIAHLYQWRSRPVMPTRIFPQSTDKPAE